MALAFDSEITPKNIHNLNVLQQVYFMPTLVRRRALRFAICAASRTKKEGSIGL